MKLYDPASKWDRRWLKPLLVINAIMIPLALYWLTHFNQWFAWWAGQTPYTQ